MAICRMCEEELDGLGTTGICSVCQEATGLPGERRTPLRPRTPCARCGHHVFVRVTAPRHVVGKLDDGSPRLRRLGLTYEQRVNTTFWAGRAVSRPLAESPLGELEAYVCKGCGVVDWYAYDVDAIPIGEAFGTELFDIDAESPFAFLPAPDWESEWRLHLPFDGVDVEVGVHSLRLSSGKGLQTIFLEEPFVAQLSYSGGEPTGVVLHLEVRQRQGARWVRFGVSAGAEGLGESVEALPRFQRAFATIEEAAMVRLLARLRAAMEAQGALYWST